MLIKTTLNKYMDDMISRYQNNDAMIFPEKNQRYTYNDLKEMYNNLAKGLLALGIKKGDHIAIWAHNCPEYIALQIAVAKIGAILVCFNAHYTKNELEYVLNHSESTTLFFTNDSKNRFINILYDMCPELKDSKPGYLNSKSVPKLKNIISIENSTNKNIYDIKNILNLSNKISNNSLEQIENQVNYDDIVSFQYTSGTTGKPKAVMSTHFSVINNAIVSAERFHYLSDDKLLICLPLFHVMGIVLSAIMCLTSGASMVLLSRFKTDKALSLIEQERCTAINAVPTMYKYMLSYKDFDNYNLTSLEKGMIGGSCCDAQFLKDIIQKIHVKKLASIYGQTEALGITQNMYEDTMNQRINSVGQCYEGEKIKIIHPVIHNELGNDQIGELCVKTPYIMKGYYKNVEATTKAIDIDGWLHTGDLATKDEKGYVKIIGRLKDIIIRGGENISPVEIEELLIKHNLIKEAVVIGVPDENLGEEICACIVKDQKQESKIDTNIIRDYVKDNLAYYKVPKYIEFIDDLPVNASGKIKKFVLKQSMIKKYDLK